jgi:hypothetical protein
MFVELTQRGKCFWSQMVANQKSDFSEYVLDGFFGDSRVTIFKIFDVLIKGNLNTRKNVRKVGKF